MKASLNWLKDFVDIKVSVKELADRLTIAGLEVTSIEKTGSDSIFEMEITSNRPDWLSIKGVAREIAAITGKRLKKFKLAKKIVVKPGSRLSIKIEDRKDCPQYTGRILSGVKVGGSPKWLQDRLKN